MSETTESLLHDGEFHNKRLWNRLSQPKKYNDLPFAIVFLVNVCLILGFSLSYGVRAVMFVPTKQVTVYPDQTTNVDNSGRMNGSHFVGGICLVLVVGGILSVCWVHLLTNLSHKIIPFTFVLLIAVSVVCVPMFIIMNNVYGALNLVIFVVLVSYMYFYLRPRMDFAAATMKMACHAVRSYPYVLAYAAVIVLFQICFCMLWTLAVVGAATNEWNAKITTSTGMSFETTSCSTYTYYQTLTMGAEKYTCTSSKGPCTACFCGTNNMLAYFNPCFTPRFNGGLYFLFAISLFWTCTVMTNIISTTTAGVISHWWRTVENDRNDSESSESSRNGNEVDILTTLRSILVGGIERDPNLGVVRSHLMNSLTYSLGSICLGSLLVALVKTTRSLLVFLIERMKSSRSRSRCFRMSPDNPLYPIYAPTSNTGSSLQLFLLTCAEYLLMVVERCLEYFNKYAFCYVGIYGTDFKESSRAVVRMFSDKGVTAIVNDEIVDIVLSLSHMIVALFCGGIAYIYGFSLHLVRVDRIILSGTGFLAGYFVSAITLKVISASVATIYVLYAEEPQEFENSNPELFKDLSIAWNSMYPANSKALRQAEIIHRDVYGRAVVPEPEEVDVDIAVESVKIAGRYKRVSTREEDNNNDEEEDAHIVEAPERQASPNPYGSASSSSSSQSQQQENTFGNMMHKWYAESVLLYRAAMGQSLSNNGDQSSDTIGSNRINGDQNGASGGSGGGSGGNGSSNSKRGDGGSGTKSRAVISGSWGSDRSDSPSVAASV